MHKMFFSKISGYVVVLSFALTLNIIQPVFAETKTKENPDGSKMITASSGYEWTVGKDGKTVTGKPSDAQEQKAAAQKALQDKMLAKAKRKSEEQQKKQKELTDKAAKRQEELKKAQKKVTDAAKKKPGNMEIKESKVKDEVNTFFDQKTGQEVAKEVPAPNAQEAKGEAVRTKTEDEKAAGGTSTAGAGGGTTPQ